MSDALERPSLPPRDSAGHKGTFGTVCVLGGQVVAPRMMIGGPALSALAALRVGAGLVVLALPEPILAAGLTIAPSATGLALPVDAHGRLRPSDVAAILDEFLVGVRCLAVGPGLGMGVPQQQIVARLIGQDRYPIVVDADALNALAELPQFAGDLRATAVLTPHPGEFARLARALELSAEPRDPESRRDAAEALARRLGCVVVLKGAGTVITDGVVTAVNDSGNAALATAGTGDVLTGIIAGLIAQFGPSAAAPALSLVQCAAVGVHLHGLAAEAWASRNGEAGMLAGDLLRELPGPLSALRKRPS